jgi:hypothetical protein
MFGCAKAKKQRGVGYNSVGIHDVGVKWSSRCYDSMAGEGTCTNIARRKYIGKGDGARPVGRGGLANWQAWPRRGAGEEWGTLRHGAWRERVGHDVVTSHGLTQGRRREG